MKTGIVILNYNNIEDTCRCVESVYRFCNPETFVLCVVDNCSNEHVVSAVEEFLLSIDHDNYSKWTTTSVDKRKTRLNYFLCKENLGYAKGNNVGLKLLEDCDNVDSFLILNNDIILTEDILTPTCSYLRSHANCAVVSPLLYSKTGEIDYECARKEKSKLYFLMGTPVLKKTSFASRVVDNCKILKVHPEMLAKNEIEIELPSGSCMLIRKEDFQRVNYFDEGTFLYFEEDILWSKFKSIGKKSILMPTISCIHIGASTTSKNPTPFIRKCYRESMMYYLRKYSGFPKPFMWYISITSLLQFKFNNR